MLSEAARTVCGRWFGFGEKSTLRSFPPHEAMAKNREALNELVAAGIVTEAPFNNLGAVIFTGTPRSAEIGAEVMKENMSRLFGNDSAQEPQP